MNSKVLIFSEFSNPKIVRRVAVKWNNVVGIEPIPHLVRSTVLLNVLAIHIIFLYMI